MKVKEKMPINDGITVQIQRHSKGIGVVFHEIIIAFVCVFFEANKKRAEGIKVLAFLLDSSDSFWF